MGALVDGLPRFSRLSREPLALARLATAAVARQALAELGPEREGRQVEVTFGDLPECRADPVLLTQVYVNLLSNALKFTRGRRRAYRSGFTDGGGRDRLHRQGQWRRLRDAVRAHDL
jgi:signal transduction histidine kinase